MVHMVYIDVNFRSLWYTWGQNVLLQNLASKNPEMDRSFHNRSDYVGNDKRINRVFWIIWSPGCFKCHIGAMHCLAMVRSECFLLWTCFMHCKYLNKCWQIISLWLSEAVWNMYHGSLWLLVQVMPCFLMMPSHCLMQMLTSHQYEHQEQIWMHVQL